MKKNNKRAHRINEEIIAREVRVDGVVMPIQQALLEAEKAEVDLVLINDKVDPVICKIVDYQKFIYEQKRKEKDKPKPLDNKEIKLGPNTAENDLEYRSKHIIEFLGKGHKVKLTMQFRGREMAFVANGELLMLKLIDNVSEHGLPESMPKMEGKKMMCTLKPKVKK
jgi:translation initiation factor IF-3